ncbi:MAG: ROK family protein, partial [Planctomycetes bacterium]|nr:ROK family protein [Planctomycetota bacterium]
MNGPRSRRQASAPSCVCGNRGCLEALASGTAIARIAQERVAIPGGSGST